MCEETPKYYIIQSICKTINMKETIVERRIWHRVPLPLHHPHHQGYLTTNQWFAQRHHPIWTTEAHPNNQVLESKPHTTGKTDTFVCLPPITLTLPACQRNRRRRRRANLHMRPNNNTLAPILSFLLRTSYLLSSGP